MYGMCNKLICLWALCLLVLLAGCNKAPQEQAATDEAVTVAEAPAETPKKRQTTGGNVPPPKKVADEQPVDLLFNSFTTGDAAVSEFTGKPMVVNLWAVW